MLSNPNASVEAKNVYGYIKSVSDAHKILTGQQESVWYTSPDYEMDYIKTVTGKYPAIRGLDFLDDDFDGVVERAKEWVEKGGIVTICWHCGADFTGAWEQCMNTEVSDWEKLLTQGTDEYNQLIAGMDKAGAALAKLRDAGVPVLWRPFHELDGGWFWWGKGGAENFVKLWKIMYERYTEYWKLDNLIWVLGYSHMKPEVYVQWYPGDEYVDIAGADSYASGPQVRLYDAVRGVVGDEVPVCFHECGTVPTVDEFIESGAGWAWFMVWHSEYIMDYNEPEALNVLYNHESTVTLDELPGLAQ